MKKTVFLLFALFLSLGIATDVQAVPANPEPTTFTQPNGEVVSIIVKGDERISWCESIDGYTLLFDDNGYLTYAIKDSKGDIQPSTVVAVDIEKRDSKVKKMLSTIDKKMYYSREQVLIMQQIWNAFDTKSNDKSSKISASGKKHILFALVGFDEYEGRAAEPFERTAEEFHNLANQIGYSNEDAKGSVKDWFLETSYGQLDLTFTIAGPYLAPKSEWYYTGGVKNSRCPELARWLLEEIHSDGYDFSDLDSDGDGIADCFHFIYAGNGQEATGVKGTIWSHKSNVKGESGLILGGIKFLTYSCSPERNGNSKTAMATIGVICHEMTHVFGAPDYYDTDGRDPGGREYDGTGNWDVMASGSYNDNGNSPACHNIYQKMRFGWIEPIELKENVSIYSMPNSNEHPIAYVVNTSTPNEFFIMENRQKLGFDSHVPGSGLLIYRVAYDMDYYYSYENRLNAAHAQKMYPVCASSTVAIPIKDPESYGSINSAGCPFPGSSDKTSFTDESTPSAKSWAEANTGKPITNIVMDADMKTIAFDFMGGTQSDCASPSNLVGEFIPDHGILLKWDAPEGATPSSYNVYRNDILVGENISATTYTGTEYDKVDYAYYVTANINGCESKPSNIVKIHVLKDMYNIDVNVNIEDAGVATGAGQYEKGTMVSLKATANDGHKFLHWYSDGKQISRLSSYKFTAKRDVLIVAVFDEPYNSIQDVNNLNVNVFAHNNILKVTSNQDSDETFKIDVIDINGRIVKTAIFEGGSLSIPVEGNGVFIIRVINDSKVFSKKVVL